MVDLGIHVANFQGEPASGGESGEITIQSDETTVQSVDDSTTTCILLRYRTREIVERTSRALSYLVFERFKSRLKSGNAGRRRELQRQPGEIVIARKCNAIPATSNGVYIHT